MDVAEDEVDLPAGTYVFTAAATTGQLQRCLRSADAACSLILDVQD